MGGTQISREQSKASELEPHIQSLMNSITSQSICNGAIMTFSFQIEQDDEIKCYLWWNQRCIRFLPNDIIDLLPYMFVNDIYENNKFSTDELAKEIVVTVQYKDRNF